VNSDPFSLAFEKASEFGEDSLSPREREYYLAHEFLLEFESGSLCGYLYNRIEHKARAREAVRAMRSVGWAEVAAVLEEAVSMFDQTALVGPTWSDDLRSLDPSGRLDVPSKELDQLYESGSFR
jgi:hypothetical protein